MIIQSFPSGPFATNAYVIGCRDTQEAAVIDPAPGSLKNILSFLHNQKLKAVKIIITHSHWDHIGDAAALKAELQCPLYIHSLDVPNLERPGADGLPLFNAIQGVCPDHKMGEGDVIEVGNLKWEVIHTPGHTPGGVCLYCKEEGILISGDTLFKGSIGNLSFPTCEPDKMWSSLDKLAKLPPQTAVFPGHGPSTTIGEENWLPKAKQIFGY